MSSQREYSRKSFQKGPGEVPSSLCETSIGKGLHALDFLPMMFNSQTHGETAAGQEAEGQQEARALREVGDEKAKQIGVSCREDACLQLVSFM